MVLEILNVGLLPATLLLVTCVVVKKYPPKKSRKQIARDKYDASVKMQKQIREMQEAKSKS